MTKRRWIEYSIAVLVGNAIYFWVLYPGLTPDLQHQPNRFDLGLGIAFACCVLVYAAIRLGRRHAGRWFSGSPAGEADPPKPSATRAAASAREKRG